METYPDFGPTLVAEQLREVEGIGGGISSVRRWQPRRERRIYRSLRERFGAVVQFDGSSHRWGAGSGLVNSETSFPQTYGIPRRGIGTSWGRRRQSI